MPKYICIAFLSAILSLSCFSQTDSAYIEKHPHEFSLKIYSVLESVNIFHEYGSLETIENDYASNRPMGLGLGFSYRNVGLSFSYSIKPFREKDKGDTKSLDLQYHIYGKKMVFDIIGQLYEGFYSEEENEAKEINYNIHNKLKVYKLGLSWQYVFNSKKFSHRAALGQSEKQLKSAGSFLLGGEFYYNQIHSDIPYFFSDSLDGKEKYISFQFGPNVGYAYTWVFKKHFFLSLSVSVGFNLGINHNDNQFMFCPTTLPRFGFGYNAESWSLGLSYVNNLTYAYFTEERQIALNTGQGMITFVKRFNRAPKFLRKSSVINNLFFIKEKETA